ncbi:MAG TPA: thiamine biosynthesis protein ThiC, partial [Pseudoalteromonas sp.]|nr:thiamine biosynthesis protein ThiC [Pseudoalteromonas sp.]
MEFTNKRTMLITASLLLVLAISQGIYSVLYSAEISFSRQVAWGLEALVFTLLVAFAG